MSWWCGQAGWLSVTVEEVGFRSSPPSNPLPPASRPAHALARGPRQGCGQSLVPSSLPCCLCTEPRGRLAELCRPRHHVAGAGKLAAIRLAQTSCCLFGQEGAGAPSSTGRLPCTSIPPKHQDLTYGSPCALCWPGGWGSRALAALASRTGC